MLGLIPLPYRILIVVLSGLVLLGSGFAAGHRVASNAAEAERAKEAKAALAELNKQIARGNSLSEQLAKAESVVITKTVEVIKHVPSVTTGRVCLGAAAVGLLQPGAQWGPYPAAGKPAAQSPADAAAADRNPDASDRDVAYWIAEANREYETCAGRLNALVDWFAMPSQDGQL